jgi:hypothetical protein
VTKLGPILAFHCSGRRGATREVGGPRILFIVANNRDLNQVTWELREEAVPDFPAAQHLPGVPVAAIAGYAGGEAEGEPPVADYEG